MNKVDSPNCPDFSSIVDKAHISLSRSIKLLNLDVSKAFKKLSPNLCSHAVTNGQSDSMVFIIFSL